MAHWLAASAVASSFIELGSSNVPSFSAELESLAEILANTPYVFHRMYICVRFGTLYLDGNDWPAHNSNKLQ